MHFLQRFRHSVALFQVQLAFMVQSGMNIVIFVDSTKRKKIKGAENRNIISTIFEQFSCINFQSYLRHPFYYITNQDFDNLFRSRLIIEISIKLPTNT